ncbi:hypothetical protein B0H12DRAFT_1138726 [Mycena haematopus]|nr:hypothetical protein B0H12DRAFT_1138726 [Mycena haematopus]
MKFIFSVLLAAVTSVVGDSYGEPHLPMTDTTTPGDVLSAGTSGYNPEGVAAGILAAQLGGSTPYFRLFNADIIDHAYTASATEVDALEAAGYVLEPTPGFVYTTQICGSVPLYGTFLPNKDHFYTTSPAERNRSFTLGNTDLGITAYVPVSGIVGGFTC